MVRAAFKDVAERFFLTKENCPGNGAFLDDMKLVELWRTGMPMFGLFSAGALAGFVAVYKKSGGTYYMQKLAVAPMCRGSGYGAMLVAHCAAYARQAGAKRLCAGIIEGYDWLRRWYEDRGFTTVQVKRIAALPFAVRYMELPV